MPRSIPSTERLIAYLDGELSEAEAMKFEKLIDEHPEWREELDQLREVTEATSKLRFAPPPEYVWDHYWEEIDERISKKAGWALISTGGLILAVIGAAKILSVTENIWIKLGLAMVIGGGILVFVGVLRGHLLEKPRDRYRRIKR